MTAHLLVATQAHNYVLCPFASFILLDMLVLKLFSYSLTEHRRTKRKMISMMAKGRQKNQKYVVVHASVDEDSVLCRNVRAICFTQLDQIIRNSSQVA